MSGSGVLRFKDFADIYRRDNRWNEFFRKKENEHQSHIIINAVCNFFISGLRFYKIQNGKLGLMNICYEY